MNLRGDVMDFPNSPEDRALERRGPNRLALWLMVAMIGFILGGAALAAACTTDTRDFAARHASVLRTTAL
ncbi:MAG: hypothetical protein ABI669_13825 [Usitatibacter sp.]